jgi:hypothetical protein
LVFPSKVGHLKRGLIYPRPLKGRMKSPIETNSTPRYSGIASGFFANGRGNGIFLEKAVMEDFIKESILDVSHY